MTSTRLTAALALLMALGVAAAARADDVVAELDHDTPIAAYGGVVAWSDFDAASGDYHLVLRRHGTAAPAPVRGQRRPFDVSLGPDARGRVVALYTRCRVVTAKRTGGCDVYRLDVTAGRERRLTAVSSPHADEAWPAQWGGRVAFVRRAQAYVDDAYHGRPDPRGRRGGGPKVPCDIPYVSRGATPRRLDRRPCAPTTGLSLRGTSIVLVTEGEETQSQVRRLDTRGGSARVLARTPSGEDGYSPFVSPSQSGSTVWVTQTGLRLGVPGGPYTFTAIDLRSKRVTRASSHVMLAGAAVRDERGTFWYVQAVTQAIEDYGEPPFCTGAIAPCRLMQASASPFSHAARTLAPEVTIATPHQNYEIAALYTDPPVLAGDLGRPTVRDGAVVAGAPLGGVALELWQTDDPDGRGTYRRTGRTATTDADGHWSFALEHSPPHASYRVLAPSLRIASEFVAVTAAARVTLTADGRSLTGTVTPAHPGRSVAIQRLDRTRCRKDAQGAPVCDERAWKTVATAPLDAAGTGFSATVAAAGTYRADLPLDATPQPTPSYPGRSDPVVVS